MPDHHLAVRRLRTAAQAGAFAAVRFGGRPVASRPVLAVGPDGDHLTCVLRLPRPTADRVATVADGLPDQGALRRHAPGDLHLTVANLDRATGDPAAVAARIRPALAACTPPHVLLRGLAMTRYSVFVQAWDPDGDLLRLRRAVETAAGVRLPPLRRALGFVNVARFAGRDVGALRDRVRELRDASLGGFTAEHAETVLTDTMLSAAATRVLDRVLLGAARP